MDDTAVDQPFLMPIEEIRTMAGRGTVVTGRIERGILKIGDPLQIVVGSTDIIETTCIGIEAGGSLTEARAGDQIGVLLRGVKREDIMRGQVLAAPGRAKA